MPHSWPLWPCLPQRRATWARFWSWSTIACHHDWPRLPPMLLLPLLQARAVARAEAAAAALAAPLAASSAAAPACAPALLLALRLRLPSLLPSSSAPSKPGEGSGLCSSPWLHERRAVHSSLSPCRHSPSLCVPLLLLIALSRPPSFSLPHNETSHSLSSPALSLLATPTSPSRSVSRDVSGPLSLSVYLSLSLSLSFSPSLSLSLHLFVSLPLALFL